MATSAEISRQPAVWARTTRDRDEVAACEVAWHTSRNDDAHGGDDDEGEGTDRAAWSGRRSRNTIMMTTNRKPRRGPIAGQRQRRRSLGTTSSSSRAGSFATDRETPGMRPPAHNESVAPHGAAARGRWSASYEKAVARSGSRARCADSVGSGPCRPRLVDSYTRPAVELARQAAFA
jgi:hypothetical protein